MQSQFFVARLTDLLLLKELCWHTKSFLKARRCTPGKVCRTVQCVFVLLSNSCRHSVRSSFVEALDLTLATKSFPPTFSYATIQFLNRLGNHFSALSDMFTTTESTVPTHLLNRIRSSIYIRRSDWSKTVNAP